LPSLRPDSRATSLKIQDLRSAARYLPDNIYDALANFRNAEWINKLLGEDVKAATPT
jgi:glutamine synthetase